MSRAQQLLHIVYMKGQYDHDDPYPEVSMRWAVDEAFTQLLILTESLGLRQAYKQIRQSYDSAKKEKEGLSAGSNDPMATRIFMPNSTCVVLCTASKPSMD